MGDSPENLMHILVTYMIVKGVCMLAQKHTMASVLDFRATLRLSQRIIAAHQGDLVFGMHSTNVERQHDCDFLQQRETSLCVCREL